MKTGNNRQNSHRSNARNGNAFSSHNSSSGKAQAEVRRTALRILCSYLIATAFLIVFAAVYNHFGHGVRSRFMDFAWIWPALGAITAAVFSAIGKPFRDFGRVLLRCGLATLAIGSVLEGIFEIAGTNSPFMPVFAAAGLILLASSIVTLR